MTDKLTDKMTEIQNKTETLTRLEAELSDLGAKMASAADNADSSALIALAHKRNDLPIEILSARTILERLLLRRDEERLPQLQDTVAELAKPLDAMQKQIIDLQREFNIASGAVSSANEDVREVKMAIGERKRSIESLLRQARNVKIAPQSLLASGAR